MCRSTLVGPRVVVFHRSMPVTEAVLLFVAAAGVVTGAGGPLARAGDWAILTMALALAALVHGTGTRVRRLEPEAVLLLVGYAGVLYAVWSLRP